MRAGFALLTLEPGQPGGSEVYVRELLTRFSAGAGDQSITVLANSRVVQSYHALAAGPVAMREVNGMSASHRSSVRAAMALAARTSLRRFSMPTEEPLDVIHYPVTVPLPACRAPSVVTVHYALHHDMPWRLSRFQRAYRRVVYDGAARSAEIVVTPTAHARGRLVDRLGLDPAKVEAIHHGIDLDRFRPEPTGADDDLLAVHALPRRFVVYPAAMFPHKNHLSLVEAFSRVTDPSLALVLTGQSWGHEAEILQRARQLRIADRVRHLGYVGRDVLPPLYRKARAMVFPSLYEGFGWPPLEGMACGCPVASSRRGSLEEVCGDAVLPFNPRDPDAMASSIDRIVEDEALRATLRDKGFERAALFSWSRSVDRHLEVYRRAVQGRPERAP